jgi:hypothetical protein
LNVFFIGFLTLSQERASSAYFRSSTFFLYNKNMPTPEIEPQEPTQAVDRGPLWELYTSNPEKIDDKVARRAWSKAYNEFLEELEATGRDFDMAPVPTGSLTRKTDF